MIEEWKDIPEYEGLYQASTLGRIRTHPNKTTANSKYTIRKWNTRIMKGRGKANSGYRVGLWKDGKCKEFLVARIVATTFLDNYINTDMTVNHKNGNRFDNRIENLEWLSLADNIRHGFNNGLYPLKPCVLCGDNGDIKFPSYAEASRFLGRNNGYISCLLKRGYKEAMSITGKTYQINERLNNSKQN